MTSSLYTFKYSSTWLLYVNTDINIAINSITFSNSRRQNQATVIKISCYHTMLSYHVIIPVDHQIDQQEGDTGSTRKWPLTRPRLPFANSERIHADCLPTFMGPAKHMKRKSTGFQCMTYTMTTRLYCLHPVRQMSLV